MKKENIPAYEVLKQENLTDIHSAGYLVRHKKTGARLVLIENDDENKVFSIAFRTTPKNSTGVPHILEHSVLCGSREFPLKDPFRRAGKGLSEYLPECHDLPGQDLLSGGKLQ